MGKDLKTGEVLIQEYGKQIPGQMAFSDIAPAEPEAESQADGGKKTIQMPRALRANG